jgi:hypothetical protein
LILCLENYLKFFWQFLSFFSLLQNNIFVMFLYYCFKKICWDCVWLRCQTQEIFKFELQKNIFFMFLYYFWNSLFKKHILRLCLVERRDSRNWNIFHFLLYFKLIFVWYFFLIFKLIRSCLILHFKNSLKKIWEFWSFFFLYFKWFFFFYVFVFCFFFKCWHYVWLRH